MKRLTVACSALSLLLMFGAGTATADTFNLDFQGNAGFGLLPGNEVPPASSSAFGGETGGGITYDDVTNMLSIEFNFTGLTGGGLINAGDGGIHIHNAGSTDPFNNNGGIVFNLNSGFANVAENATSGSIDLDITLSEVQEGELLNGQYYVNIHSGAFNGGELRGNLVVSTIPEPTSATLLALGLVGLAIRRKR